ncbi:MAG: RdgB/HAM1 family non-canonical purine NTP pyrophosphatase [Candidatus Omnitrophica bacterium]|nr:RdgB/HAM1 family non-canonical purine NTP pyrophosphatase [Candidatus Omnitrophota bacterium]
MKRELVISTRNKKKFREIKRLFKGSNIKISSLNRFPGIPRVIEDKKTFNGNAVKKALLVSRRTKRLVLADDSGLEVYSLHGRPGVFSSRYAGPGKSDRLNCLKLLRALRNKPPGKRKARFRCAVAIADEGGLIKVIEKSCSGKIGYDMEGGSGFGYDPLFIPRGYKKSFAQLGSKVKDKLSHRGKALRRAKGFIEKYLSGSPRPL